jgi:Ni/Co efflux regulator RcnB
MERLSFASRLIRLAVMPLFAAALGAGIAQAQQDHGNPHDQGQKGNPHAQGQQGNPHDSGSDFHFRDQDRNQLQSHYTGEIRRLRSHPQGRPQFARGQQVPSNYRFQPVPATYYRGMPPPPSGYRYGYSNGYVVAYNPTTRIIGDVLDLVNAASH